MKKTGKLFLSLSVIALSTALAMGCGSKNTNNAQDGHPPALSEESPAAGESGSEALSGKNAQPDSSAETVPKDTALVFENFSSGTIYDEGEYFFQIDSMEMTDEGYVITYRAASDPKGYQTYYDMILTINGTPFKSNDFKHTSDKRKGRSMIGTGRDSSAQVLLDKELLDMAGITEIRELQFDIDLGHEASSIYPDVEFTALIYP